MRTGQPRKPLIGANTIAEPAEQKFLFAGNSKASGCEIHLDFCPLRIYNFGNMNGDPMV